jgi:hypothetical protein
MRTMRTTIRTVSLVLAIIVTAMMAAGAGAYWLLRTTWQIQALSAEVSKLRQDEAARAAAFGSAIAQLHEDSIKYFTALGSVVSEMRTETEAYFKALGTNVGKMHSEQASRGTELLRQLKVLSAQMQDDVTALTFSLGGHRDPKEIVLGSRETYDILDQDWKSMDDTSGKTPAPCQTDDGTKTLVVITLGQSNAANSGAVKFTPVHRVLNFNLYDGRCYLAADPLLGASNNGGNFATRLGDILISLGFADRVVLAPIAMAGSRVEQWAYEGVFNNRIRTLIRRLYDAKLAPDYILWHQGEANLESYDIGGRQYRKNLLEVVSTFRQYGIAAPFFIALATRCGPPHPNPGFLRSGQQSAVNAQIGTFLGPDTDLIGLEHRFDECHMRESGLELHARAWADAIANHRKTHGAF